VTGSVAIAAANARSVIQPAYEAMPWDAPFLRYAVREPSPSKSSQATLIFGRVDTTHPLKLKSLMPENGVIFSDGIEADYVTFNSGVSAEIGVAKRQGRIVV
jgi:hypothetical protein